MQYWLDETLLGFAAEPGRCVCLQMKRQCAHVVCSAAVQDHVEHGSYGSEVEHGSKAALAG